MYSEQFFTHSNLGSDIQLQSSQINISHYQNIFQPSGVNQKSLQDDLLLQAKGSSMKYSSIFAEEFGIAQQFFPDFKPSIEASEDPIYNVLNFRRGTSENWCAQEDKESPQNTTLDLEKSSIMHPSSIFTNSEHQHPIMHEDRTQGVSAGVSSKRNGNTEKGKNSSKNVTKNMGKLLLKWIWAHRQHLRQQLLSEPQAWQYFIDKIKAWKKENNLTRKFLTQRWHGPEEVNRLFRIVSAHFFRCESLGSVMGSSIEDKWMHIQRRGKFLEGTMSRQGLNSLN